MATGAIRKVIQKALGKKSGKSTKPQSIKELKDKTNKLQKKLDRNVDNSTLGKLKQQLQNAMPESKRKELKAKIAKEKARAAIKDKAKTLKDKKIIRTLEKEKKRQLNVNKNQKSGGGVNKIVKGDESKDALRTAPLTQKELKEQGAVSGPSSMAFMAAIKGKAKALAEQVKKKQKLYDALSASDKKGEKGQLLQNAIKDMQKKLKGQVPIRTLRDAKLLNQGGLLTPKPNQTGLKKLPTAVRNKMGYMMSGGMAKKPRMSNTDYRKGGMVMIMLDMMKKKKGK